MDVDQAEAEVARLRARAKYRPCTDAEKQTFLDRDFPDDGSPPTVVGPPHCADKRTEDAVRDSPALAAMVARAVEKSSRTGKPVTLTVPSQLMGQRKNSRGFMAVIRQPRRSHRRSSGRTSARRTGRSGAARALPRSADEPARPAPGRNAGLALSLAVVGGLDTLTAALSGAPATGDELRAAQAEMIAEGFVVVHRDVLAGLVADCPHAGVDAVRVAVEVLRVHRDVGPVPSSGVQGLPRLVAESVDALATDLGRLRRQLPPDTDYLCLRIVGHLEVLDRTVHLPAAHIVRDLIATGYDEDEAVALAIDVVESRAEKLRSLTGTGRPGGSRRASRVAGRRGDEP